MDKAGATFSFALNRTKLRIARRREGRYLLRTNLTETDPAQLWAYYIQLTAVEEAFKTLKGDLAIRPVYHQDERRIEAHIFVAFMAYCLYITLHRRLHALAPGLTARRVLEKFAAVQMIDVHLPTSDGRELRLTRHTQPEPDLQILIAQLKLLAATAAAEDHSRRRLNKPCSDDLFAQVVDFLTTGYLKNPPIRENGRGSPTRARPRRPHLQGSGARSALGGRHP